MMNHTAHEKGNTTMLTKEMATKQVQAEAPSQWAQMTPQQREEAVQARMHTIRRSEDRYLNAIPPAPNTGVLEADLQAANNRRLLAQEYAQAEVTAMIEAQAPTGAVEFWTWWTKTNPGKQPLIEAWVELWPAVVEEWLSRYPESEWTIPWRHHNEWTAFNWEEHAPEFSQEDSAKLIDLDSQIEALVESIVEHAQAMLTHDLKWITGAGPGPDAQAVSSRTALTWEAATQVLNRSNSGKFPLDLLPQEATDAAWEQVLVDWDMEDQDPYWIGFETQIPAWMVTWLERHPGHWLTKEFDAKTRRPTSPHWAELLRMHQDWKAAQG